jgi:hypothetical protein
MSNSKIPERVGPALDRRATLAWAGAVAAALATGAGGYAALEHYRGPALPTAKGYGVDPNMMTPVTPWPRTLTKDQLAATALLCDYILPAEGKAPAASAIGVHQLIDEWVSAPYPDQVADRKQILGGLTWLDHAARRAGGRRFAAASAQTRLAVLASLLKPTDKDAPPAGFYAKVRKLTIGAYYTTEAGFADIGYIGNQALNGYPGASPAVKAHLDRAYAALRLSERRET